MTNNITQYLYSTRCWIDGQLKPATIGHADGKILSVELTKNPEAHDFGDLIIMPGIIDAHVHVNEPGRTAWEGFETATMAAAAGGITTIADMPLNASPVTTTLNAFRAKLESAKDKLHVNCAFYGGLIPGNNADLEALISAGVSGIKCFLTHSGIDEFPNVTEADLDEAMPILAKHKTVLLVHCELFNEQVECDFQNHTGSYKHYLASRPKQWENDAISLMIRLCRKHNCPVHNVHVSSAESLEAIRQAKEEGLPITAETCPQYIFFAAEDIPDHDCVYKCAPPIRERANNELLKQALKNGTLDLVATDHSPAPADIKEISSGNLQKAWGGIAGIQFLLPVAWTALKENMSPETFIPLITEHPAALLKLDDRKGKIIPGYDADLTIWNPDAKRIISHEEILFRHKISPYIGKEVFGMVERTIVNGITAYENNTMIDQAEKAGEIILSN